MLSGVVFATLLAGHVIADFIVQSDCEAKKKGADRRVLAIHCGKYACVSLVTACVLLCVGASATTAALACGLLAASHAMIDAFARPWLSRRIGEEIGVLFADQILHLACIFFAACMVDMFSDVLILSESYEEVLVWGLSLLLSTLPSGIAVRALLNDVRGEKGRRHFDECCDEGELLGSGCVIGLLERGITCVLTLLGQFDAIAFILAAKSIARYERLKEKTFAEEYLVGTLMSIACGIACPLFSRWVVGL